MPTELRAWLFGLHASHDPMEARERQRLEQQCRNNTRPALFDERLQINAAGRVELKLRTRWRDRTTHQVICPPEFM